MTSTLPDRLTWTGAGDQHQAVSWVTVPQNKSISQLWGGDVGDEVWCEKVLGTNSCRRVLCL